MIYRKCLKYFLMNRLKIEKNKFDMDKFIQTVTENLDEAIDRLVSKGNVPIIAHPERYLFVQNKFNSAVLPPIVPVSTRNYWLTSTHTNCGKTVRRYTKFNQHFSHGLSSFLR